MAKNASQTEKGQNLKDTPKQEKGVSSAAHAAAVAAAKKERPLPDPCGKSEMAKINIALHNFMTTLKGIKAYGELYVMGSINKLQNLTSLIRQTSTIIGAVMKTLMSRLRDFLIDKIHSAISALIDKLLPQIAKAIKNTVIQVIVDNIFCAFKDIVKNLVNLAVDFLKQMVEKVKHPSGPWTFRNMYSSWIKIWTHCTKRDTSTHDKNLNLSWLFVIIRKEKSIFLLLYILISFEGNVKNLSHLIHLLIPWYGFNCCL